MTGLRWGILGTGNIARSMAEALHLVPGATLQAVASRSSRTAEAFAERWGIATAHGSYEAFFADPSVDVVYIATPNALHKDNILAALAAGKHILCEKPLTTSPEDSRLCGEAARAAGLFLMEAMWTAFMPAMRKAQDLIAEGAIGRPMHLTANFIAYRDPAEWPNLYDPDLGGGASMDLGIYPVTAAELLLGPVISSKAEVLRPPGGVDEMVAMILQHETGALSHLGFGFRIDMPVAVRVTGDGGTLDIPHEFHHPDRVILTRNGTATTYDLPPLGMGYAHEAIHVQECIAEGRLESPVWPLQKSIDCAALLRETAEARGGS